MIRALMARVFSGPGRHRPAPSCRCGHDVEFHEHYHAGTYCGPCGPAGCAAYRVTYGRKSE